MMVGAEERDRFEAWAKARGHDLHKLKLTGGYRSALTADAWASWQAALVHPKCVICARFDVFDEGDVCAPCAYASRIPPPEGYVLIQAGDARRLCAYSKHSPSSALAARRVKAILAASPEIPNE